MSSNNNSSNGPVAWGNNNLRVALHVKWRRNLIIFENVDPHWTSIAAIKAAVEEKTGVAPSDQKLIGLGIKMGNATPAEDSVSLSSVTYKNKSGVVHIQLMGTPQAELIEQQSREMELLQLQNTNIVDDLSLDITPATREWRKLQEFASKVDIHFLNRPRPGKKLLILDLDHTLMHFDSKEEGQVANTTSSTNHNMYQSNHNAAYCESMKRPYLDYFLSSVYPYYDIVMWSQTHWRWIEIKLTELGIIMNPGYKVCFILDKSSMFKIPPTGYVKPLQIIWSKFGHLWGRHNTVHVDDMERNFVLNKQTGLLVTPFYRNGYVNAKNDILTHTLAAPAYGAEGLILSSIATVSSNSYMNASNYAANNASRKSSLPPGAAASSPSASNNGNGVENGNSYRDGDRDRGHAAPGVAFCIGTPQADPFPLIPFAAAAGAGAGTGTSAHHNGSGSSADASPNRTHYIVNSTGNAVSQLPGDTSTRMDSNSNSSNSNSNSNNREDDISRSNGSSMPGQSGAGSAGIAAENWSSYGDGNLTTVCSGTTTSSGSSMNTIAVTPPQLVNVAVNSENILAPTSDADVELYHLARYLINISHLQDLSVLDHCRWRLHCHHVVMPKPTAAKQQQGDGPSVSATGGEAVDGATLLQASNCGSGSGSGNGSDSGSGAASMDADVNATASVNAPSSRNGGTPQPHATAEGQNDSTSNNTGHGLGVNRANDQSAPDWTGSNSAAGPTQPLVLAPTEKPEERGSGGWFPEAAGSSSSANATAGRRGTPQSPAVPPLSLRGSGTRLPAMNNSPSPGMGQQQQPGSHSNTNSNQRSNPFRDRSGGTLHIAGGGAAAATAMGAGADGSMSAAPSFGLGRKSSDCEDPGGMIVTSRSDNGSERTIGAALAQAMATSGSSDHAAEEKGSRPDNSEMPPFRSISGSRVPPPGGSNAADSMGEREGSNSRRLIRAQQGQGGHSPTPGAVKGNSSNHRKPSGAGGQVGGDVK